MEEINYDPKFLTIKTTIFLKFGRKTWLDYKKSFSVVYWLSTYQNFTSN